MHMAGKAEDKPLPCCNTWCNVNKKKNIETCDFCADTNFVPGESCMRGSYDHSKGPLCDTNRACTPASAGNGIFNRG